MYSNYSLAVCWVRKVVLCYPLLYQCLFLFKILSHRILICNLWICKGLHWKHQHPSPTDVRVAVYIVFDCVLYIIDADVLLVYALCVLSLQFVFKTESLDVNIRWMAILYIKNGVDRYWRKTAPQWVNVKSWSNYLILRALFQWNNILLRWMPWVMFASWFVKHT